MSVLQKTFGADFYRVVHSARNPRQVRLDCFARDLLPSLSRAAIQKKIREGEVQILGRQGRLLPGTSVREGDRVEIVIYETRHEEEWWRGKKLDLEREAPILYEDERMVVIRKPPFMSTHPTGRHLFNCATVFLSRHLAREVHSVHRLDRETSGLLVVGKSPQAARELGACFEEGRVGKGYFFIAVERGEAREDKFTIRLRLGSPNGRGLDRVRIHSFPQDSTEGKSAETFFHILHRERGYVLGLAFPATGRQHQIRVHALAAGLPLLGDKLYLGSFEMFQRFKDGKAREEDYNLMELPRQALHAAGMSIGGRCFLDPLPADLRAFLERRLSVDPREVVGMIESCLRFGVSG